MAGDRPDVSFFISIHIPKTAETVVATVLRALCRRVLFDYPSQTDYFRPDPLVVENADFLHKWFCAVHGHFAASRYLKDFAFAKYIASIRHPVDRIISQYLHEYDDPGADSSWHHAIRSGKLDVVDFAAEDGIGDAMSRHLKGLGFESYDLLLVTEQFAKSLHSLNYALGDLRSPTHFGSPPVFPEPSGDQSMLLEFDGRIRSGIFNRAPKDVEVYLRAVEMLQQKSQKYLG